ncbi:sialidase-3-like [Antennarius striatus]|uniref:sialidase-3-like n=1 Tax=Antennarius striatus TaxID=241820 RepID=UPI0035B1C21E
MSNKVSCPYKPANSWETVFLSKEKEVYRIPALFYDSDKKLFVAFAEQRRTTNDASAEMLVMRMGTLKMEADSDKRSVEWLELKPVKEAYVCGYRSMNPCPVYEKTTKTLFLFFICVMEGVSECWQRFRGRNRTRLCYITSKDAGQSWSGVKDLTCLHEIKNWATFAVGPGHGIQTETGRLIVPLYAYTPCKPLYLNTPYAMYLYSDDNGGTWQFSSRLRTKSVECEMAEVSGEAGLKFIYCNARSEGGHRVEAVDKNNGAGFVTLPPAEKLVETGKGCQGSVLSFPPYPSQNHNQWLLFTHPSDKSKRINLGVYLNKSPTDPYAWSKPWIISSGPSGYSDLAYIHDGWFACLVERGEQRETEQIACVVFHYDEVKRGIGE